MILEKMPEDVSFLHVAVVFCFNPEGKVILLRKRKDDQNYSHLWSCPSGKVKTQKKECAIEAALREVREETSVKIPWQSIASFGDVVPAVHFNSGEAVFFYCHTYYVLPGYYCLFNKIKFNKKEHCASLIAPPEKVLEMDSKIFIPDAYDNLSGFIKQFHYPKKE